MRKFRLPRTLTFVAVCLVIFLYLPLVIVILFSFDAGQNLIWPLEGLSLRWFEAVFEDPSFRSAITNSAIVGSTAAVVGTAVGFAAALVFVRTPSRSASVVASASRLPVMIPPLLIGASILTALAAASLAPGVYISLIPAHIMYVCPYAIVIAEARLRNYDIAVEEAARDLGARPVQVFRRVTLPLTATAVAGAGVLALAFSFDEVLMTNFIRGQALTLPTYIVTQLRLQISPSINAVATILLIVPWIMLGVGWLLLRGSRSWSRGTEQLGEGPG